MACASGAFTRGPNAKVQGRALGMAEAIVRIGVPCNAQLGAGGYADGSVCMRALFVDCLVDGQLECKHSMTPCASQEAKAGCLIAAEQAARLAVASGEFSMRLTPKFRGARLA